MRVTPRLGPDLGLRLGPGPGPVLGLEVVAVLGQVADIERSTSGNQGF